MIELLGSLLVILSFAFIIAIITVVIRLLIGWIYGLMCLLIHLLIDSIKKNGK